MGGPSIRDGIHAIQPHYFVGGLLGKIAAVNIEVRTGGEFVLDEKHNAVGNLFRLTEPTKWMQSGQTLHAFLTLGFPVHRATIDIAGVHGVHTDVILGKRQGDGLRQQVYAALRSVVGRQIRIADRSLDRGGTHNSPTMVLVAPSAGLRT